MQASASGSTMHAVE